MGQTVFSGERAPGAAWARGSARMEMADLAVTAGGRSFPAEKGEFTVTVGEKALRVRAAIFGLALDPQALGDPRAQAALKDLGYDSLKLEAALAYRFERDQELLAVEELPLGLAQAGKLTASLELGGVKRDLINDPGQDVEWLKDCYLKGFSLAYQDHSLAERIMAMLAKERGVPLDLFKELAIMGLQANARQQGVYLGALAGFIRRPQSLCLEAKPDRRLTLGQAAALPPEQVAQAWNVKLLPCP